MRARNLKTSITIAIAILSHLIPTQISGQEMFSSQSGILKIIGAANEVLFEAKSDDVNIVVDFETARFTLRAPKSSLHTGVDSIDKQIEAFANQYIVYEGTMKVGEFEGAEYLMAEGHNPTLDFEVEGYLSLNEQRRNTEGSGRVEYIFGAVNKSLLVLKLRVSLKEFGVDYGVNGLDDVYIKVVQPMLSRRT